MFPVAPPAPLITYLAQVLEWNPHLGLVSKKDPVAACERLLMESLELGLLLDVGRRVRVVDVGSGAGFPGVVWAIVHPHVDIVLIERRQKRALFLERMCRALPLPRATVVERDIQDTGDHPAFEKPFDLIVTMAVGDPTEIGLLVEPLVEPNGYFASTVSRETPALTAVGSALALEQRVDGKSGCYAIYRRGV